MCILKRIHINFVTMKCYNLVSSHAYTVGAYIFSIGVIPFQIRLNLRLNSYHDQEFGSKQYSVWIIQLILTRTGSKAYHKLI